MYKIALLSAAAAVELARGDYSYSYTGTPSSAPTASAAPTRTETYLLHLPIGDRGSLRLLRTHECCPEPANRPGAVVHFIGLGDMWRGVVRGLRCIGRYWPPERPHGTSGVHARRPNSLSNGPRPLATAPRRQGAASARDKEGYVYTITLYTSQHLHDDGVRRPLLVDQPVALVRRQYRL